MVTEGIFYYGPIFSLILVVKYHCIQQFCATWPTCELLLSSLSYLLILIKCSGSRYSWGYADGMHSCGAV